MKNHVLATGKDQWQVVYNDHVLPSIWLSKGEALAALNNLESAERNGDHGSKDCVICIEEGSWQVYIDGEVLPTTWNSKGAAEAGLAVERRRRDAKMKISRPPERLTGLLAPTVEQLMANFLNITSPPFPIEVKVDRHRNVLWVNVGPVCLLRICRWEELVVEDSRKEHEEPTI